MADENKTEQNPDALENLTPEELQERIQEDRKKAKRSLRFAFTALIAIIAVCIAWFAVNSSVTATGMSIKALSTNAYLQIKHSNTTAWSLNPHITAAAGDDTKEATLNPTHIFKSLTVGEGDASDTTETYSSGSTVVWATATSNDVTSAAKSGHYSDVTSVASPNGTSNGVTTYTLFNTFNLRLRPNDSGSTQPKAGALTASVSFANTSTDEIRKAVSVFIVVGEKGQLFTNNGSAFSKSQGDDVLASEMTNTEVNAKIYVFFDGENESCFTNNVEVSSSYSVTVTFSVASSN